MRREEVHGIFSFGQEPLAASQGIIDSTQIHWSSTEPRGYRHNHPSHAHPRNSTSFPFLRSSAGAIERPDTAFRLPYLSRDHGLTPGPRRSRLVHTVARS